MSTDSLRLLRKAWLLGDEFQKNEFQKKNEAWLQWDLNPGPLLFAYNGQNAVLVRPDWNLSLDLFCSFIKDKPLSYSANGDWVVF